jgi:endonuclease/exonuclease/phosphatase family metal-dependent hydrolase
VGRLSRFRKISGTSTFLKQQGEFCAIFYDSRRFVALDSGTFWLSQTPQIAGSKSWNSQCVRKIDYIYVDPAWEVERAEIVLDRVDGRWISDHMPVTAEIRLGSH